MLDDLDDEPPTLSQDLLNIIAEVSATRSSDQFPEDWQLSQFWYDDETAVKLAEEAVAHSKGGRIAFLSSPTAFRAAREHFKDADVYLFEFDNRFSSFGERFFHYDFNNALLLPGHLQSSFDYILADPPFLSPECLQQTVQTMRWLRKAEDTPMMMCTGLVMEELARKAFATHVCSFQPKHKNNLSNAFAAYTNYPSTKLGSRD